MFLYVGEYRPEEKQGPAADWGTPGTTPPGTPVTPGTLMPTPTPTPRPTIDFCTACCICSSACSSLTASPGKGAMALCLYQNTLKTQVRTKRHAASTGRLLLYTLAQVSPFEPHLRNAFCTLTNRYCHRDCQEDRGGGS